MAVGTREGRKTYPAELLAKALVGIQTPLPFVLLGGPGEEAAGAQLAKALKKASRPVLDLVGQTPLRQSAKRPIVEWWCHPMDVPTSTLSFVARFAPWQARALQIRPAHAAPGCEHLAPGFHEIAGCRSLDEAHCIAGIQPETIAAAAERMLR